MTRLRLTLVIDFSREHLLPRLRRRTWLTFAGIALFSALPARSAVNPDADLSRLLDQIGRQTEKFWDYFSSVTCTETLTQSKIGDKGKVLFEQHETFDYLIILQASGMDIAVDESRVEKTHKATKGSASLLETNGFSIFTLIFHPLYQSRYEFRRLPDEVVGGRQLLRIAFHQMAEEHPLSVLQLREREYPLMWTGTAWIDPQSLAVVRIQAGLGNSMAETGLLRMDTDVTYSDVAFNESTHYWLPAKAVIEAETKRQHWRNTHLFGNYRRFEVETEVKTANPQ
jgi:hypothetical protein